MNFFRTVYIIQISPIQYIFSCNRSYLDSSNVGVLSNVLVLVETIFGSLSFTEIDAEFNEQQHHRLERGNGAAARPLGGDMFVEDVEGSRGLAHGDEFLSPLYNKSVSQHFLPLLYLFISSNLSNPYLENILGLNMRRRRHDGRYPLGSKEIWRWAAGNR